MQRLIRSKVVGGVLLIAGTTLGVGMLAFPVSTVFGGLLPSIFLFILIWLVMLSSAFFFLDANLSVKGQNNMVTMAEETLGTWGKVVSWVVYLLLLYSLIAAFISGTTPLFVEFFQDVFGVTLPKWLAPLSLPIVFGGFIYAGTKGVDIINRFFMAGLVIAFFLLIFFVPGEVQAQNLTHVDWAASTFAIPVIITAFGFHVIIPSLTTYLKRDVVKLRRTILIGSTIPIFVYLLWQILVLGTVPMNQLIDAYSQAVPATTPLAKALNNPFISLAAKLFSFFAIATSFIGVALSLSDFLTDGFKIQRTAKGRIVAILLTFLPPLFFVYTYPKGFYVALQYAGAFVAILLVFLPAAMVWNHKKYRTKGKRAFLCLIMAIAVTVVTFDILEERGMLSALITKYTQN